MAESPHDDCVTFGKFLLPYCFSWDKTVQPFSRLDDTSGVFWEIGLDSFKRGMQRIGPNL